MRFVVYAAICSAVSPSCAHRSPFLKLSMPLRIWWYSQLYIYIHIHVRLTLMGRQKEVSQNPMHDHLLPCVNLRGYKQVGRFRPGRDGQALACTSILVLKFPVLLLQDLQDFYICKSLSIPDPSTGNPSVGHLHTAVDRCHGLDVELQACRI